MAKLITGILIVIVGFLLGAYLGIRVCFIGGIIQIINALQHPPIQGAPIAFGIAKIFFAALVGWGTFIVSLTISKLFFK